MEKWISYVCLLLLIELQFCNVCMSLPNQRYAREYGHTLFSSRNSRESTSAMQSQEAATRPITTPFPYIYPQKLKKTAADENISKLVQNFQIMIKLIVLLEKKISTIEHDLKSKIIKDTEVENVTRVKDVKNESTRTNEPEELSSTKKSVDPETTPTSDEETEHTSIFQMGNFLKNLLLNEIDSGLEPKPLVEVSYGER